MTNNPFQALGPPPEGNEPRSQLLYLQRVMEAFAQTAEPRVAPLKRKLQAAVTRLAQGTEREEEPEQVAARFGAEVARLRLESYELLLTLVNQVRATLRVQLARMMPPDKRIDSELLQKGLGIYAQGLRKLVTALKTDDESKRAEAHTLLDEAGKLLESSAHEPQ